MVVVFYPQQLQVVHNRLVWQRLHKYVIQIVGCRGTQAHVSPGHVCNVRTIEAPPCQWNELFADLPENVIYLCPIHRDWQGWSGDNLVHHR